MLGPYSRRVCVVPWGMDPARFPWPPPEQARQRPQTGRKRIFMAAVVQESHERLPRPARSLCAAVAEAQGLRADRHRRAGGAGGRVYTVCRLGVAGGVAAALGGDGHHRGADHRPGGVEQDVGGGDGVGQAGGGQPYRRIALYRG